MAAFVAESTTRDRGELGQLNVGGLPYSTTLATLCASPVLSRMFTSPFLSPCSLDSSGRYFIDRNGEVFKVVLEFLRSGRIVLPPGVADDLVRAEFDFFALEYTPPDEDLLFNSRLQHVFEQSILPIWLEQVLIPFVLTNKKAPFYLEKNGRAKFFFTLRGKLGNYIVDDSFYRIQESKEGYLAFNAHNIDVSRYVMDLLRDYLLRNEDSKDIFQDALLRAGEFTNVSFKIYSESLNGVDTHSLSVTAFK